MKNNSPKISALILPYVSIIIPTYRDWDRLNLCLDALLRQSYSVNQFEVIVVDNDAEGSAVPRHIISLPNLHIIKEVEPGSYSARNAGLSCAKGEIIGFTDSDCIPHADWISNAVELIQSGNAPSRVTGPVDIFRLTNSSWMAWKYESITAFNQMHNVSIGVSVTANLFVKASVFKQVGKFDASLFSGGDFEWNKRATDQGVDLVFSNSVCVAHPARESMLEILKKSRRVTGGQYLIVKKRKVLFNYLIRQLAPPIKSVKRLVSDERPLLDVAFVLTILWGIKIIMLLEIIRLRCNGKPLR